MIRTWATWSCLTCSRRTLRRSAKHAYHTGVLASSIAHAGISCRKKQWPTEVFIVYTLDLLSIPEYVIKKGRPHGHRYGKVSENKEYYLAHDLKKRCVKGKFTGIRDRFLRDHVFRKRMLENNRDDDVCRKWDDLAEQDHTYRMSESEYFHYRQNGWISLNKSRNTTEPMRKRSDFNQALSTLNRLHREAGGKQLRPLPYWKYQQRRSSSSCSSTWWQWSGSWWSS